MSDEELYLVATSEVDSETLSPALWAKVIALSEGDIVKAKYHYIRLRVEQLKTQEKENRILSTKNPVDKFDLKYMPISEFSVIKSISEKNMIEMIRGGFYVGQLKGNEWYVSREEVGKEDIAKNTANRPKKLSLSRKQYIPVEEFAEFKGITAEKAINMIRDGLYEGQIIDEKWYAYAAFPEVETTSPSPKPEGKMKKFKTLIYIVLFFVLIKGCVASSFGATKVVNDMVPGLMLVLLLTAFYWLIKWLKTDRNSD